MAEMTPRERVMVALRHEEPDRVPLDIGGGKSTSLVVEAFENLKKHLGITATGGSLSKIFRVSQLDEESMIRLRSDVRPVTLNPPRNWTLPPSEPDTFIDEFGIKWRKAPFDGSFYWELAHAPLAEASVSDLGSYPWPDPLDPGRYDGLAEKVKDLFHNTPYALMGDCGFKNFWEVIFVICGLERALIALLTEQEFILALMDILFEINSTVTKRFLEITGPYLAVIRTSDDLATQKSLMMSPDCYRQLFKPYHKRYFELIKDWTDAKIFFHSCGNVVPILDELIDAGVEVLNPVQVASFEDPAGVKNKYGDKLSFWGGIDTQRVLPMGTSEEVREEVKLRVQQFGPGGGYVVGSVHNIQPDVPPENILAMSEAVMEFGHYPIR